MSKHYSIVGNLINAETNTVSSTYIKTFARFDSKEEAVENLRAISDRHIEDVKQQGFNITHVEYGEHSTIAHVENDENNLIIAVIHLIDKQKVNKHEEVTL